MSVAATVRRLGWRRQGHNWRGPCPLGCGYTLSLAEGEGGKLLLYCFGGCTFDQIMPALVEFGLLDDDDSGPQVSPPVAMCQRDDVQRIAHARQIYESGVWDERIAVYLRSRGIHLISSILRFTEQAPHRLGTRLPAMLAPVVGVDGAVTGLHATYLKQDGSGKAALLKEYQRETRGLIRRGAIRLFPFNPDLELLLSEGVETGLAASEIFCLPCWSAVSAVGLRNVVLPSCVRRIAIAADNDASGAGQRNALLAYDRLRAEGRSVRIVAPPMVGDFDDLLRKEPADAQ